MYCSVYTDDSGQPVPEADLGANEAIWQPTLEYARVLMLFFVRFDSDPNLVLATSLAYTIATLLGFTHFLKKKHSAAFRGQDRDA